MRNDSNGWEKLKLGDVFKTTSGGTPSRRNPEFYTGTIPWVKSGELESNVILEIQVLRCFPKAHC